MPAQTLSVRQLAEELKVNPKTIRAWMRRQNWRHPVEVGSAWVLTAEQVELVRQHFSGGYQMSSIRPSASAGSDDLAAVSVGQLLERYAGILAELRLRGLVRTNNAPIGDLAEHCAAIVYDGLLAPNSEKSYDLVAGDGRKVQVKVRVIRSETSPSAVFSPIRSFGFDVGLFLLIDGDRGGVLSARELTANEVRIVGRHRAHSNGVVVRVGQVRSAATPGIELTDAFRGAWEELIQQVR
ncbi:DUF6998 domain-containing protein [Microbacterium sp. SMR1]|uniref:DUF6998 domain-containing protein n=1 Tax=Microbacterium sp. SMR1 TaxID=1497340 RepID=UPI0015ECBCC4|nr:hypothetical protein [Microbacterium sp. SMR1]